MQIIITNSFFFYLYIRCDIGGINNSTVWQTEYFNQAYQQNRQVTINDRCGNDVSDFTTLEYKQTDAPPSRFWEATRGIYTYILKKNHNNKIMINEILKCISNH